MNITAKHIIKRLENGIENDGCYTSEDFKKFCREFKSFINKEIKKVGGTNYKQNNGHYYISGFFTVGDKIYYISLDDIRSGYFHCSLLIRTAKNYQDFTGGRNHFLEIQDNLFNGLPEF